jgi:hypothetical protein
MGSSDLIKEEKSGETRARAQRQQALSAGKDVDESISVTELEYLLIQGWSIGAMGR